MHNKVKQIRKNTLRAEQKTLDILDALEKEINKSVTEIDIQKEHMKVENNEFITAIVGVHIRI